MSTAKDSVGEMDNRPSLILWGELLGVFLRLGIISFGGPAAHIALMEEELVRRRKWLTSEEFLDLLGATNLIPGPNSTELALFIGRRRGGLPGLLLAGAGFILPAVVITTTLAWIYVETSTLPQAAGLLYAIKPVMIAVVVQALWGLLRKAVKTRRLMLLAFIATLAAAGGGHEVGIILLGGIAGILLHGPRTPRSGSASLPALGLALPVALGIPAAPATPLVGFNLTALFWSFVKVGAFLFGSGYVLLAFLRVELVDRLGWLTEAQLLDAVAVGQFTPGPVFSTATFIGYLLGGVGGATVATVGIFLPAFVLVAVSGPLIPGLRRSPLTGAFLDGVNVASLALMGVVSVHLTRTAVVDLLTLTLVLVSGALLHRGISSAWLVLGGGLVGWATTYLV